MADELTTPRPCPCPKCRHIGFDIFARHLVHALGIERMREIVERWHAYYPQQRELERELPYRAAHLSYRADEANVALAALVAWNDHTGEYEDIEDSTIAVLAGPPGTGKTVAAVWLAMHRLADQSVVFRRAADLARLPRYRRTKEDEHDERAQVFDAGVLILDDLGVEVVDKRFAADLDELVDRFYQGNAQLIVTTNLTPTEFKTRYGRRVFDRLAECGTWIAAIGPSLRARRSS